MSRKKSNYKPRTLQNISDNRYFLSTDKGGLYSHLFIEDVTTHIMPFQDHSSSSNKFFEVIISNPSLETEVKSLFSLVHRHRDSFYQPLHEVIFGFVREVASFLLMKGGRTYFEIVDGTAEDNGVSKKVCVLQPIHSGMIRFGKTYYQIVPKNNKEVKERYIPIPQGKIWALEISPKLGEARDIIALSSILAELGKSSFLGSEIVTNNKDYFGFDVNNFHSSIEAAVLRSTQKWGWDKRMVTHNRHALDYYLFYRMLRFGYSMAIFRSDMLSKMNSLLNRLGYDVILSLSGIPTPDEFLDAIKKMEQRELSFTDAFDLISFY